MLEKRLNGSNLGPNEDWEGNNAAFSCPVCKKVYIVSDTRMHLAPDGTKDYRECPNCGQSKARVSGGKLSGGIASIEWKESTEKDHPREGLLGSIASTSAVFIGSLAIFLRFWWYQPKATFVAVRDLPIAGVALIAFLLLTLSCAKSLSPASLDAHKVKLSWWLLVFGMFFALATIVAAMVVDALF